MSSVLRCECERCGTVEIDMSRVDLMLARPDLDGEHRNVAQFTCPQCGSIGRRHVNERATRLLSAAGVQLVATNSPPAAVGSSRPMPPRAEPDPS